MQIPHVDEYKHVLSIIRNRNPFEIYVSNFTFLKVLMSYLNVIGCELCAY
jgi:hypothetical protein